MFDDLELMHKATTMGTSGDELMDTLSSPRCTARTRCAVGQARLLQTP